MTNSKTWLLIADASKARIYSLYKARVFQDEDPRELKLINQFTHEESRKKDSELASDRQGEFGSGTFVESTSPKAHEAEQFALELIAYLEIGRKKSSFRDLILVAPPTFMGLLHKQMSNELQKLISQRIEKDYTQQNENDLMQNLLNHF